MELKSKRDHELVEWKMAAGNYLSLLGDKRKKTLIFPMGTLNTGGRLVDFRIYRPGNNFKSLEAIC